MSNCILSGNHPAVHQPLSFAITKAQRVLAILAEDYAIDGDIDSLEEVFDLLQGIERHTAVVLDLERQGASE